MPLSYRTPLWFYPEPVDFRRQIDGLVLLVSDELKLNPTSGELFFFRNRRCDKVKLLWYEYNGFWLCYKRLEKGKLVFPSRGSVVMELTRDQLSWLLSGLNLERQVHLPACESTQFF